MGYAIRFPSFFATMLRDSARLHAVFVVSLALSAYEVNAENACKPHQIWWKSDTRYKCLECPECPEGSQPSVPCGSLVEYGTPVHCVQCDPGRTYSNSYGKSQCRLCTVCSEGRDIKKNCTLFANTECDDKCINGYYHEPFIFKCFRCANCCGDEHDEKATDCASGETKKCKRRSTATPGKRKESHGSTDAATTNNNKLPSNVMVHDGTTSQSTKPTQELEEITTAILPTSHGDGRRQLPDDKIVVEYREGEKLLPLVYLLIALAAVMPLPVFAIFCVIRRRQRADRPANSKDEIEESIPMHEIEANSGLLTVEQFEQRHLEEFDKMCMKLDKRIGFFRGNYVSLAAKYQEISLDERDWLHRERQEKEGSPSRELMSLIKARYPNHPVGELIKNLKVIGRNDIVKILEPLVKNTA